MAERARDIWITGIGLVSSLGEGPDAHWRALEAGETKIDTTSFAPYVVHPLVPIDLDKQIPKKGDQRQMEPWQRIGTYAAGLALDSAGVKGKADLLGRMDMIVAAGGGERDEAVDGAVMTGIRGVENKGAYLNERLMSDLRPTLFLAQLSNLLAGSISIVHGVIGSSRTFMGEESAGAEALRVAHAKIASRQSDIALVGGSQNSARREMLLLNEYGGYAMKDGFRPVWERGQQGAFALGSAGAFLVLEGADHAEARGASPIAKLTSVVTARAKRAPGSVATSLADLWGRLPAVDAAAAGIISGATGVAPVTAEERAFLEARGLPFRATGTRLGHSLEPQFTMNIALAAIALGQGRLFAPCDAAVERPSSAALRQAVVTGVGHWRGEGLALVEPAV